MSDSLFNALRKYPKGQKLDPIENFITEGFAWLMRNKETLAGDFVYYLVNHPNKKTWEHKKTWEPVVLPLVTPKWITQYSFPGGQIDMLADFGQFALIFEHKIWSSLSSCQLKKYRKFAESNQKWTQYKLILITGSTQQHEQNPDLALTWSDIYQFLINWLETKSNDTLVRDFSDMLVEENLGPAAPVSYESIVSYWTAALLEPNLQKITKQAAKEDWNGVLEKIGFNRDVSTLPNQVTYQGTYQNDNGGLGVFIENGYFPSFFICTLLNVSAYKVQPSNLHLGPDFCLILNFNIDKWSLFEGKFFDSEEYTKLRSRLKNDASSWDFHDHRFEVARPNRWYHLHLRKPLAEVLRDTITFNQQVEKFVSHGRESIEILLAGGEIEALTKRLHSEIPIDS